MMWRVIPFFSVFLLAGAAAAQTPQQDGPLAAATVKTFLASCGRDMTQCDFEISLALLNKLDAKDATSVCLKGASYREPVVGWLKAHPDSWPMATQDGIYAAFTGLYPCP